MLNSIKCFFFENKEGFLNCNFNCGVFKAAAANEFILSSDFQEKILDSREFFILDLSSLILSVTGISEIQGTLHLVDTWLVPIIFGQLHKLKSCKGNFNNPNSTIVITLTALATIGLTGPAAGRPSSLRFLVSVRWVSCCNPWHE